MSAKIGPGTKCSTAETKTVYENSNQILALEVLLFVQIKRNEKKKNVHHNNISQAIMSNIIVSQSIPMRFRPPLKPEVTLTVHCR